jgi:hypothetical protein
MKNKPGGHPMSLTKDMEVLSNIPLFAKVNPARLKLLAFTSERLEYLSGDELFHQDDYGDAAYVILQGEAEILVDTPRRAIKIATLGKNESSARSRFYATCRAPPRWSRTATSIPYACQRRGSST